MTIIKHFNIIDLTGKRFGKLLVRKQLTERGNRGQIRWECICDCGNKHITSGESIRSGKSKSCGCLRKESPPNKIKDRVLAVWTHLYNSTIIKRSKKNGYKTDITFDEFRKLSSLPCFYCGLNASSFLNDRWHNKELSKTIVKYNGIDRVDSKKGYTKENSVTCCKYCNTAKNTMTQKKFYKFIKRLYEYNF
jgi:hypothetical protein